MNKINLFKPGLVIYCSKSHDGNMSKKYGNDEIVQENINNFFCDIKIDKKYCQNYHILNSDTICTFDELADYNFNTDAVIITKPNQYVYLAFGDCIPFVVYDNNKNIVGFAHLGWNSICKKLHIKLLQEKANGVPVSIIDMRDYGLMNGEKVLETALKMIENK